MSSSLRKKVADPVLALLLAPDARRTILAELSAGGLRRVAYTPYGAQNPQVDGSHLGFNGQLKEQPIGWYYLGNGHRVYNPVLMRFHSPDKLSPFGKGGLNPYVYCAGDPVNFTDPTGQFMQWVQPALSMLLNGLTFNYFRMLWPKTAAGLPSYATVATMTGNTLSIAGNAMVLGGVPGGEVIRGVGTVLSGVGVSTRTYVVASAARAAQRVQAQALERAPGRASVDLDAIVVPRSSVAIHRRASPSLTIAPELISPAIATVSGSIREGKSFVRDPNGTVYVNGLDSDVIPIRLWARP